MILNNFEADNIDLNTIQLHLTISPLQEGLRFAESLNQLLGKQLDITAKKHREKRSLNANSYFYELIGRIAEATDSSKDEIHNRMLARYGQYMRDKDDNIVFCLYPEDIDYLESSDVHLKPTGHTEDRNGVAYEWFVVMRGSHTYNTQEMAKLIDGTVDECKALGIETLSDDELKRMVAING